MLSILAILGFATAAMITAGLTYALRAWRYALGVTILCALPAIGGVANALSLFVRYVSGEANPGWMVAVAAVPFSLIVARLIVRRRQSPPHQPGPDDDPVYRRYREEKVRRRRLQRQREAELEQRDESVDPV